MKESYIRINYMTIIGEDMRPRVESYILESDPGVTASQLRQHVTQHGFRRSDRDPDEWITPGAIISIAESDARGYTLYDKKRAKEYYERNRR